MDSSGGMEPGSRLGAPSGLPRISTNGRPSPAGPSGGRHTHAAVGPAIFGGAHGYAAGVSPRTPHEAGPAGIGAGVPSVTRHSVSLYRGASGMPSLYGGSSGAQSVSADILGFYAKSPRRRARPGHGQQRGSGQRLRRMSSQSSSGDWSLGAPHAAHHAGRLGGAGVGERQRMPGQLRVGVARDAAFPLTQDQAAYLTQLQGEGGRQSRWIPVLASFFKGMFGVWSFLCGCFVGQALWPVFCVASPKASCCLMRHSQICVL